LVLGVIRADMLLSFARSQGHVPEQQWREKNATFPIILRTNIAYGIEPDEQSPGEIIYLSHIPGEMFLARVNPLNLRA
jgi:hypothetical protein